MEVRTLLGLPAGDSSEDKKLLILIEQATSIIEEYIGRPISFKSRTEFYQGTGTQRLVLKCRPAYQNPAPQVWISEQGYFGAASGAFQSSGDVLTYGEEVALQIDQDNGTSRSAVLWRMGGKCWPRPIVRQVGYLSPFQWYDTGSIKVTYSAGYTVDSLPAAFRTACEILVMKLRNLAPYGWQLTSESYEERSISLHVPTEDLLSLIRPILFPWRNTWF